MGLFQRSFVRSSIVSFRWQKLRAKLRRDGERSCACALGLFRCYVARDGFVDAAAVRAGAGEAQNTVKRVSE